MDRLNLRVRAVLIALTFSATAAFAGHPNVTCVIEGPQQPWTKKTELDVTVRCGPSKIAKVPGDCAMFYIEPRGGVAWTAWANEDPARTVRTFRKGELLVVGDRSIRIYTRNTHNKDKRVGPMPPGANPLSELTMEERERLGAPLCPTAAIIKDVRLDGPDHLILVVPQKGLDSSRREFPPVLIRVAIADGSMTRLTKPVPSAPLETDVAPPPPEPAKAEAPASTPEPVPDDKPADRPTAKANFGKPVKDFKAEGDSSCAHVPGLAAFALLSWIRALRRRR